MWRVIADRRSPAASSRSRVAAMRSSSASRVGIDAAPAVQQLLQLGQQIGTVIGLAAEHDAVAPGERLDAPPRRRAGRR